MDWEREADRIIARMQGDPLAYVSPERNRQIVGEELRAAVRDALEACAMRCDQSARDAAAAARAVVGGEAGSARSIAYYGFQGAAAAHRLDANGIRARK